MPGELLVKRNLTVKESVAEKRVDVKHLKEILRSLRYIDKHLENIELYDGYATIYCEYENYQHNLPFIRQAIKNWND